MAFYDTTWYCNFGNGSSTGYYAVTVRPQNAAVAAGVLRRQFTTPAVGSERVFVCIVAGTTANVTDATWVLTRGAKTTDGTATWQECTGQAALNGDLTNTATWAQVKAATPAVLGQIIKRSNNASYQICTTAGAMSASEPAFSNTAGVTTTDTTAVWTSLGVVGNFSGGGAPHARLANAFATNWFVSGNTVYVGDNHAETQATALTVTFSGGTINTLSYVLCHNHSGSYPPTASDITTGATISTTAAVNLSYNLTGSFYTYGLTFKMGVGASSGVSILAISPSGGCYNYLDNCSFWIANTATAASNIQIGGTGAAASTVVFNNTTVKFGNINNKLAPGTGLFIWQNTGSILVSGSIVPSLFFSLGTSAAGIATMVLEALDLSQITTSLFTVAATTCGSALVKDCKLNASVTVASSALTAGFTLQFVRSDSGAVAYGSSRYTLEGTETTETSITRVGGAVDPSWQAQSRKVVTTASVGWTRPFKAEPYTQWNATTGANVTVTVYGTINSASIPNSDDIWMECEYLSDSGSPLGKIVTTTKASILASPTAVSADVSAWNGMPSYTTFNGTPSAGVVMSNGNLTATHGTTNNGVGVASLAACNDGKYYFEITAQGSITNGNHGGIYVSGAFTSAITTGNATAVATGAASSLIHSNGSNTGKDLGVTAVGDVFGFALDMTSRLGWIRRNAGNWNADPTANPATGVGGVTIAAGDFVPYVGFTNGPATDAFKGNFGQVAYINTPPAGFGNWPIGWLPFKLTTTLSSPQPGMAGYLHARIRVAKPSTTYYIDPQITLS